MKKNCKFCGTEFEAKAHNKEFCSSAHYFKHYRQNKKQLGQVPTATQLPPAPAKAPAKAYLTPRPQLDALGDFMVRTVERERDKLDHELDALTKKYEALKDKYVDLEKELENATRAIDEKPKGLSGLIQSNPDLLTNALQMGMPLLNTIAEKLMGTAQQKQLAAPTDESGQPNPIWAWLVAQPKEVQEQFVMLLEKLNATNRIKDYLEAWNRQLMKVVPKTQQANV